MKTIKILILNIAIIAIGNLNLIADILRIPVSNKSENSFLPASERSELNGKDDGTIICWLEEINNGSLRIQKIENTGKAMWAEYGVLADTYLGSGFTADSDYPLIFSDNKGGAIIIYRKIFFDREDIYFQKVDINGKCLIAPVCLTSFFGGYNYSPSAVMTNSNSIAVAWENFRGGDFNIYAQMIDLNGNKLWNNGNEIEVCNVDYDQRKPAISCNKNNNIIISWLDARNYSEYSFDLFANMLDSNGTAVTYDAKGKLIFSKVNPRNSRKDVLFNHNLIPSDNNSFITAFEHSFDNQFSNVKVMKVNADLDREWILDLQSGSHQTKPLITKDNKNGAGVIWNEVNNNLGEIFGIVVTKDGNIVWGSKTGSLISCSEVKDPYSKILPSERLLNGFYISGDILFLNWVTTNTNKLFVTNLNLADESAQCSNTLEIQDEISEGEYTSITSHGNIAVIVYKQSGSIFASLWNIFGKDFSHSDLKSEPVNFPNPFNPTTNIYFSIPSDGFVRLSVYDITGRLISILMDEYKAAGEYNVNFDGSKLSSGVYFYSLIANGAAHTKRMTMIK